MTRRVAVANQKGGVGKTTTSVNLAASLTLHGARTLLVDLDPQGNATMGCGVDKHDLALSTYDWLVGDAPLGDVSVTGASGMELAPSNSDLTAAELELLGSTDRNARLRARLDGQAGHFDYVVMDCPPSLSVLTLNALMAADGVLIPLQCEYYALEGLTALLDTIAGVRGRGNPGLSIEGIVRTMYDPRNSLTRDVSRQLMKHFGERVFRTVIPRNVRLAEAPSHGLPAILYDRHCAGAVCYMALAREVMGRSEHDGPDVGHDGLEAVNEPVRKRGLGRGLEALLGDASPTDAAAPPEGEAPQSLALDQIHRNPEQPRRVFQDEGIEELAASIRAQGRSATGGGAPPPDGRLRTDCGRASLAGGATGRLGPSARRRAQRGRSRSVGPRAHRERAARGSEPHRGSTGPRTAAQRVRVERRSRWRRRWANPVRPWPTCCGC